MKILYHGSPKKLTGSKLIPRKAEDLQKHKSNLHKAVYATRIKDSAIAMALISCKGVWHASLDTFGKKAIGKIYRGWPKQKYFYLYYLPSTTFKNLPKGSAQWASFEPVKPMKTKKLKVEDYLYLIKKRGK